MRMHDVERIQRIVSEFYGVPQTVMSSTRRARRESRPRQIAIYLCHLLTRRTTPEIGGGFARDHTTVLYSVKKVSDLMSVDEPFAAEVEQLRERCEDGGDDAAFMIATARDIGALLAGSFSVRLSRVTSKLVFMAKNDPEVLLRKLEEL